MWSVVRSAASGLGGTHAVPCQGAGAQLSEDIQRKCAGTKGNADARVRCMQDYSAPCSAWNALGACQPVDPKDCAEGLNFMKAVGDAGGVGEGLGCFLQGSCHTNEDVGAILRQFAGSPSSPDTKCFIDMSGQRIVAIVIVMVLVLAALGIGYRFGRAVHVPSQQTQR